MGTIVTIQRVCSATLPNSGVQPSSSFQELCADCVHSDFEPTEPLHEPQVTSCDDFEFQVHLEMKMATAELDLILKRYTDPATGSVHGATFIAVDSKGRITLYQQSTRCDLMID